MRVHGGGDGRGDIRRMVIVSDMYLNEVFAEVYEIFEKNIRDYELDVFDYESAKEAFRDAVEWYKIRHRMDM